MAVRHVNGKTCLACSEKMKGADPRLLPWLVSVKAAFEEVHFSWVWRGEADQNAAAASGKSELRWPHSKHNAMQDGKPASKAFDVFKLNGATLASWPYDLFDRIASWLEFENAPIDWGFKLWKKDGDHYQLRE